MEQILAEDSAEMVEQLATVNESQWFERKSGRVAARDLAPALVALANAEGGHILVGVHSGRIDGVSPERINALRQAAHDFTEPVVQVEVRELELQRNMLLVFTVKPSQQIHQTMRGDCYLRVGDESRKLSYAQRRELEYDRGAAPFETTPVPGPVGTEDLDTDSAAEFQKLIGAGSLEQMLDARDLLTRDGRPTVASWLLFQSRPQREFASAHVRVLRYAEDDRGTGARMTLYEGGDMRCEGPIPQQISKAAETIREWMPRVQALSSGGRFEPRERIPESVWYEGLVNAVLHRSYSMAGDHIRVEIFPNRIEIESPGRFPGMADPDQPLSIRRYARNPRIVRVCSDLGIARELGEGIKRIFEEMRANGLTDPLYVQTAQSVKLTLSAADAVPEHILDELKGGPQQVLNVLRREARPLSTGEVAELARFARPTTIRHLRKLRDHGLVVWEGQSERDPRASWKLA